MNVRTAVFADIPVLVALWREMWNAGFRWDPTLEASPLADTVMGAWMEDILRSERCRILVAEDGGRVVGYVSAYIRENPPVLMDQFTGIVSEIAVAESHRRTGIARRLVEEIHLWLKARGVRRVEAEVSVRNPGAQAFWRNLGYQDFVSRVSLHLG